MKALRSIGAPSWIWHARSVLQVLVLGYVIAWAAPVSALHFVSDNVPDGAIRVPAGGKASLFLDINPNDFLEWIWNESSGRSEGLSVHLYWADASSQEHAEPVVAAASQPSGNFDAPKDLIGARLEWTNAANEPRTVNWSYYTTASFWKRPEYFLPAMLPLFLLAAAFFLGRRIDRRRDAGPGRAQSIAPARAKSIRIGPEIA